MTTLTFAFRDLLIWSMLLMLWGSIAIDWAVEWTPVFNSTSRHSKWKQHVAVAQYEQKELQGEQKKVPMCIMWCRGQKMDGTGASDVFLQQCMICVLILLFKKLKWTKGRSAFISFRSYEIYLYHLAIDEAEIRKQYGNEWLGNLGIWEIWMAGYLWSRRQTFYLVKSGWPTWSPLYSTNGPPHDWVHVVVRRASFPCMSAFGSRTDTRVDCPPSDWVCMMAGLCPSKGWVHVVAGQAIWNHYLAIQMWFSWLCLLKVSSSILFFQLRFE